LQTVGHCRQAYYQQKSDGDEKLRRESRILAAVGEIRSIDPAIGGYKLWLMLCDMFSKDWMPGRDAFLKILNKNRLLGSPPRPRHTTNSNHRYHKWENLVKGFIPTGPNQLWVSDITYIDTDNGTCYLHLVTDTYSHKIIDRITCRDIYIGGSQNGNHTDWQGRSMGNHSDRGVQYCCDMYIEELQKYNISISTNQQIMLLQSASTVQ
jgi:putative transposase